MLKKPEILNVIQFVKKNYKFILIYEHVVSCSYLVIMIVITYTMHINLVIPLLIEGTGYEAW